MLPGNYTNPRISLKFKGNSYKKVFLLVRELSDQEARCIKDALAKTKRMLGWVVGEARKCTKECIRGKLEFA